MAAHGRYDLIVFDGPNLFHRAAFGFRDMTLDGRPSGALVGTLHWVLKGLEFYRPKYAYVAWEGGNERRLAVDPEYKANRKVADGQEDPRAHLRPQMDVIVDLLTACGIPSGSFPGYEADDVLSSSSAYWRRTWAANPDATHPVRRMLLVSNDHDLHGDLGDGVDLLRPGGKGILTAAQVSADLGGRPATDYVLVQALAGCSGDGIAGVPRVGEKTARKILDEFNWDLDAICQSEKWGPHAETIRKTHKLVAAQILDDEDVPSIPLLGEKPFDADTVTRIASDWQLRQMLALVQTGGQSLHWYAT